MVRHYSRLTGRVANPISNIFSSVRRTSGPPLCCRPNGLHVVVGSAPRSVRFSVPWAGSSLIDSHLVLHADPRRRGRFVRPPGEFFPEFHSPALQASRRLPKQRRPVDLADFPVASSTDKTAFPRPPCDSLFCEFSCFRKQLLAIVTVKRKGKSEKTRNTFSFLPLLDGDTSRISRLLPARQRQGVFPRLICTRNFSKSPAESHTEAGIY